MYRSTSWRATVSSLPSIAGTAPRRAGRRFASSFAGRTSARATGTLVRWGLAGAAVYYYNTSSVFADEPRYATQSLTDDSETNTSIDAIAEQRRAQARKSSTAATIESNEATPSPLDSPEGLEQEAQQQGAFNEETGEINWDCPCLGGMADGPCGEQFKAAFSCFVFSKEEPKGIDCIEHFKTMQNCFREHPDIYGTELTEDDEAELDVDAPQPGAQHAIEVAKEKINDTVENTADAIRADATQVSSAVRDAKHELTTPTTIETTPSQTNAQRQPLSTGRKDSEGDLVPKAWHDSREDNVVVSNKTQK